MKTVVFVFLLVFKPNVAMPEVGFAPTPDTLEVCEARVAESLAAVRAKGHAVFGFCKEVPVGQIVT